MVLLTALAGACAVRVTTNQLMDDRVDLTKRPNGTVAIIGDSVGYGLVAIGGFWTRLTQEGWGPVRSINVLGLHAVPEDSRDRNNVTGWINVMRFEGLTPRVAVIVVGADDVGYPGGGDVARNVRRVEGALSALGDIPVVWTTISHTNPALAAAWNGALADAATRHPKLHVCDWATEVAAHPDYLARDHVHLTAPGYAAMSTFVDACVARSVTA
jgi:hypothetical protein